MNPLEHENKDALQPPASPRQHRLPPDDWAKLYAKSNPRRHWVFYSERIFWFLKLPFFAVLFLIDVALTAALARREKREKLERWRKEQAAKKAQCK